MRKLLLASLVAVGTLACGSSGTKSQPTTASAPPPAQHEAGQCDMKEMAGAKVNATDTANGIAVEFTTSGDVAALRTHVHKMADMHNGMAPHEGGEMHGGMGSGEMHGGMGSGGMHEMHGMKMVPSRATVEDIDGGARIVLVPNDPAQLADLRTHVREHAAMMAKGECPMMETQPQQTGEHADHHPAG
jgi:hypothetical protein